MSSLPALLLFKLSTTTSSAASVDTVVLVVVDDLGSSDLGFTGSGIKTPTIDALASEGTVLDSYHVYRACSPTRAALLTSRYTIRYGLQSGVLEPAKPYGLALNETLLPQRLASGFASHAIGETQHAAHICHYAVQFVYHRPYSAGCPPHADVLIP